MVAIAKPSARTAACWWRSNVQISSKGSPFLQNCNTSDLSQSGYVHRDIKPTNIVVRLKEDRSVTAKIIDLGLAKSLDESASKAGISSPGAFVGTPEFASPEQFAGVSVDIRSDLYSLGVTLWVMVTGQTPFRGPSAEVMYQHQQ